MTDPFSGASRQVEAERRSLSPGAARRRLGVELRSLRETAGLRLEDAGNVLQRSSATMSRLEGGRLLPRLVDVAALLEHYATAVPHAVSPETRERVLQLAADGRRKQWFDPFRDVMTGGASPEHFGRLIEYETDAAEIRAYGPDLIPGLLQVPAYVHGVAEKFFPGRPLEQRGRWVELRLARQEVLSRPDSARLTAVIGEPALRRQWASRSASREQLDSLIEDVAGARSNVQVSILPSTAAGPAVMGGPFILLSSGDGIEGDEIVYMETRNGADYLQSPSDVERYRLYFESLIESVLPVDAAQALLGEIRESVS
jgi:hypothetical protein